MKKHFRFIGIRLGIQVLMIILFFIGWCKCVYKMTQCDWEPIGKAEIIYTAGTFTGLGGIIGWFDIEDKK